MAQRRAAPAILAAISGGLYALALPPVGASLLGWVALTPLFVAIAGTRPGPAFSLGTLWFFVASLGFASPMPHLVSAYFETSWLVGAVAFVGLTIAFGPLYGAWAAWLAWLVRREHGNPLLAASGLVLVEWTRTNAGAIFGWAVLAHTQAPGALVLQSADLGGAYLPGFVLAATAFAVAAALRPELVPRRRPLWLGGTALVVLLALAYGALRLEVEPTAHRGLRVAVVQGGIPHAERWSADRHRADLDAYLALTLETDPYDPDLVVWPEYAVAFDLRRRSGEREALFDTTAGGRPDLLLGAPFHRSEGIVQNSAFLLHAGRLAGRYDKNELLPFAERSPWPSLTTLDRRQYTPGGKASPISGAGAEIGVLLCSEALRPDLARRLTKNGASVLANLANDGWLDTESAARIQLRSAALRAIENRRPLVRATGSGRSAVVGPDGRVADASEFGVPDLVLGVVVPRTERTPYTERGDLGVLLAGLIVAAATLAAGIRPDPSPAVQADRQPGFTDHGE